uniref:Low-density lipoprotein receptor domain class A n=1 Tax=Romanomermis culicivorax TaxID=13658 RepID=A0A915HL85_ROMCU
MRALPWVVPVLNKTAAGQCRGHAQFNVSFPVNHRNLKCRDVDEFLCRCSDVCIPRSKWQDGNIDCPDGTDEECLEYQYDCKFGKPRCISLYNFMDGVIDCASGFDEGQ